MFFRDLLHKLNRRDTRLLPHFSIITKVTFIFVFAIGSIFVLRHVLAAYTIMDHQETVKNGDPSEEVWQDHVGNNEIFGTLHKAVGELEFDSKGNLVSWNYGDSLFGNTTQTIAYLYNPVASGTEYIASVWHNFLGGKTAYAANGYGYTGLQPLLPIWKSFRNAVYSIFAIIFIVIGIMVMLRIKVSPQAVVTIQNAIPQLIITLVLVTFSYAIAGLLIDLSYVFQGLVVTTIIGGGADNAIFGFFGKVIGWFDSALDVASSIPVISIFAKAIRGLFHGFSNQIPTVQNFTNPSFSMTTNLLSIPSVIVILFASAFAGILFSLFAIITGGTGWVGGGVGFALIMLILAIITIIWVIKFLFGIFKCYVSFILRIIIGPVEIALGAFPNSKVGFSSWIWGLISNLAVFPISFCLLLLADYIILTLVGESVKDSFQQIAQLIIGGDKQIGLWSPSIIGGEVSSATIIVAAFSISTLSILSKLPDLIPQYIFNIKPSPWGQAIGQNLQNPPIIGGLTKATTTEAGKQVGQYIVALGRATLNRHGIGARSAQNEENDGSGI